MIFRKNYKVLVLLILMMMATSLRAAAPAAFRGRSFSLSASYKF